MCLIRRGLDVQKHLGFFMAGVSKWPVLLLSAWCGQWHLANGASTDSRVWGRMHLGLGGPSESMRSYYREEILIFDTKSSCKSSGSLGRDKKLMARMAYLTSRSDLYYNNPSLFLGSYEGSSLLGGVCSGFMA